MNKVERLDVENKQYRDKEVNNSIELDSYFSDLLNQLEDLSCCLKTYLEEGTLTKQVSVAHCSSILIH